MKFQYKILVTNAACVIGLSCITSSSALHNGGILSEKMSSAIISERLAWPLVSYLDLKSNNEINEKKSVLNIAMPSGNTSYYVTIVPRGETYTFKGDLPKDKDILYSSLSVYNNKGLLVKDKKGRPLSWNMESKATIKNLKITAPSDNIYFVIMRFYRSDGTKIIDKKKLLKVTNEQNQLLSAPSKSQQLYFSKKTSIILSKVIQRNSTIPSSKNKSFYIPSNLTGLFPNNDAIYAIASPGKEAAYVKITGILPSKIDAKEKNIVYLSFMAVNYKSTATIGSISFEKLGGFNNTSETPYELYILNKYIDEESIKGKKRNSKFIKWDINTQQNNVRGIVFRVLGTQPIKRLGEYRPKIEYYYRNGERIGFRRK